MDTEGCASLMNFYKEFESSYLHCGKIDLDWSQVQKDLITVEDEQSKNWSIINNDTYTDANSINNEYVKYGYNQNNTRSWKTTNFDPPITFEWEDTVRKMFPLDNSIVTIHRQDPGQVLPWHWDRFMMLKKLFPNDTRPIWRFQVFLEDWKLGHILQIEDSVVHHWKQGDIIVWKPRTEHLAANVGIEKKWTCQVTGFLTV